MGMISDLVDAQASFYRPSFADGFSSDYEFAKPLLVALEAIEKSGWADKDAEDRLMVVSGAIYEHIARIEQGRERGFLPSLETFEQRRERVQAFAEMVIEQVFLRHCKGERSLIREQRPILLKAFVADWERRYNPRFAAVSDGE